MASNLWSVSASTTWYYVALGTRSSGFQWGRSIAQGINFQKFLASRIPPSSGSDILTVAPAVVLLNYTPVVRSSGIQLGLAVGGCLNCRSARGDIFGEILEDVPSRFVNQIHKRAIRKNNNNTDMSKTTYMFSQLSNVHFPSCATYILAHVSFKEGGWVCFRWAQAMFHKIKQSSIISNANFLFGTRLNLQTVNDTSADPKTIENPFSQNKTIENHFKFKFSFPET